MIMRVFITLNVILSGIGVLAFIILLRQASNSKKTIKYVPASNRIRFYLARTHLCRLFDFDDKAIKVILFILYYFRSNYL